MSGQFVKNVFAFVLSAICVMAVGGILGISRETVVALLGMFILFAVFFAFLLDMLFPAFQYETAGKRKRHLAPWDILDDEGRPDIVAFEEQVRLLNPRRYEMQQRSFPADDHDFYREHNNPGYERRGGTHK